MFKFFTLDKYRDDGDVIFSYLEHKVTLSKFYVLWPKWSAQREKDTPYAEIVRISQMYYEIELASGI